MCRLDFLNAVLVPSPHCCTRSDACNKKLRNCIPNWLKLERYAKFRQNNSIFPFTLSLKTIYIKKLLKLLSTHRAGEFLLNIPAVHVLFTKKIFPIPMREENMKNTPTCFLIIVLNSKKALCIACQ